MNVLLPEPGEEGPPEEGDPEEGKGKDEAKKEEAAEDEGTDEEAESLAEKTIAAIKKKLQILKYSDDQLPPGERLGQDKSALGDSCFRH
jgi:hypothetical protein